MKNNKLVRYTSYFFIFAITFYKGIGNYLRNRAKNINGFECYFIKAAEQEQMPKKKKRKNKTPHQQQGTGGMHDFTV